VRVFLEAPLRKFLVASIAAGAMVAGSATFASAADFAPPPEPVSTWTGFWVGAGVGYGFVNHELGAEAFLPGQEGFVDGKADLSGIGGEGWLGQVGAGFDFQVGDRFLIGIFGDYTFSDIKSSASVEGGICISEAGCAVGEVKYSLTADSMWFVGGRAGYLANPDTLLYGLVGYSEVDFDANFGVTDYECDVDCSSSAGYGYTQCGLTFGGGVETKLAENITAKIEYRYINLDRSTIFSLGDVDDGPGAEAWTDSNLQTVTASVAWRFWTGPAY